MSSRSATPPRPAPDASEPEQTEPEQPVALRRSSVADLVALGLALCLVLAVAGVVGRVLWVRAHADDPDVLDDPVVVAQATQACETLRLAVIDVPEDRPPDPTATAEVHMAAEDDAIADLVATMRTLPAHRLADDAPAEDWVETWEQLVVLRETNGTDLGEAASSKVPLPTFDGEPITQWMSHVGVPCVVAPVLGDPATYHGQPAGT